MLAPDPFSVMPKLFISSVPPPRSNPPVNARSDPARTETEGVAIKKERKDEEPGQQRDEEQSGLIIIPSGKFIFTKGNFYNI